MLTRKKDSVIVARYRPPVGGATEAVLSVAPGFEPMHAAVEVMVMLGPMHSDRVKRRPSLDAVTDWQGADPLKSSDELTPA